MREIRQETQPGDEARTDPGREINSRLDARPFTLLHLIVAAICGLGFAVDLMELAMGGVLSTVFSAPPHSLSPTGVAWLVGALYAGAVCGAPLLGAVADRVGLARTLSLAIVWLAITSLLAAASRNAEQLAVARLLSGLALGAYPPLMIAYLSALGPPSARAGLVFLACAVGYVAPPLSIFAVRALSASPPFGVEAWRWPFAVGGMLCVFIALALRWMPEAPRWLAARGQFERARAVVERFERSRALRGAFVKAEPGAVAERPDATPVFSCRALAFVVALYFLNPWATVAFPLMTGPVLLARGFGISEALFYVGLASFGPSLGVLIGAPFVDRLPRRAVLLGTGALMLLAVVLFFCSHCAVGLAVAVIAFGVFTALNMPTLTVYGAEQFPEIGRSFATSLAWAVNRVAAACAPFLLLPMLRSGHTLIVALVIGASLLATLVLVTLYHPTGKRRA